MEKNIRATLNALDLEVESIKSNIVEENKKVSLINLIVDLFKEEETINKKLVAMRSNEARERAQVAEGLKMGKDAAKSVLDQLETDTLVANKELNRIEETHIKVAEKLESMKQGKMSEIEELDRAMSLKKSELGKDILGLENEVTRLHREKVDVQKEKDAAQHGYQNFLKDLQSHTQPQE